jgi:hypothetical protein
VPGLTLGGHTVTRKLGQGETETGGEGGGGDNTRSIRTNP